MAQPARGLRSFHRLGIVRVVSIALPRTPRIASPAYHRSVGFDVLALGLAGFVLPLAPGIGGGAMLVCFALAFATALRRRTMGAYEGQDGLVVRNYLRTRQIPWANATTVRAQGDFTMPWLKVAVVVRSEGSSVPVSALRHFGEPTQDVLTLTRIVRERREARSRETWKD